MRLLARTASLTLQHVDFAVVRPRRARRPERGPVSGAAVGARWDVHKPLDEGVWPDHRIGGDALGPLVLTGALTPAPGAGADRHRGTRPGLSHPVAHALRGEFMGVCHLVARWRADGIREWWRYQGGTVEAAR